MKLKNGFTSLIRFSVVKKTKKLVLPIGFFIFSMRNTFKSKR